VGGAPDSAQRSPASLADEFEKSIAHTVAVLALARNLAVFCTRFGETGGF